MASLQFESESRTQTADPVQLIQLHLQNTCSGCLTIASNDLQWFIYVDCGQLIYITHSVDPVDRLDCHLKRLGRTVLTIDSDLRTQVRLSINLLNSSAHPRPDLQGINHLVQGFSIDSEVAVTLAHELSREALESLILLSSCRYTFESFSVEMTWLSALELEPLLVTCRERVKAWQAMGPLVWSPYQRPYMFSQQDATRLAPETQRKLGKLLRGFSFRHLAILLGQDELRLARSLFPLVEDKIILLRDPQSPYGDLPSIPQIVGQTIVAEPQKAVLDQAPAAAGSVEIPQLSVGKQENKCFRIACIDDSPAMLQTIERFLENEELSLFLIEESVKALMELMRIKPDLILLDVGMPTVDGYELCRLLRKNPMFRSTPIIMVTGNTGLIDRAKAKLAGTTDYMTKPFTQAELQKMVFRHLT